MITFPKYEAYQESGVAWLNEVPSHWEIKRFKFLYTRSNAGEVIDKSHWHEGEELLFTCQRTPMSSSFSNFSETLRTKQNDLLLTRNGTPYVHIPPVGAIYSNVVQRVQLIANTNRKFIWFALSNSCLNLRGYGDIIESFNMSTWNELLVPFPSVEEQNRIVKFLDRKTAEIDEAIAHKQRLVELLQEQKAILINQAVTKGLNPDAPMRDSGINWIGKIPEEWTIVKLKHISKFVGGGTPSKEKLDFWDGDINWISPKDMKQRFIKDSEDKITLKGLQRTNLQLLDPGTIVIVVRGMILARKVPVALTHIPVAINQDMKAIVLQNHCLPEYLLSLLEGLNFGLSFLLEEAGHGTRTLPTDKLGDLLIPLPSRDEQVEIIREVRDIELEFKSFINLIGKQISQLGDLKRITIANTVTGKIKV